MVCCSLSVSVGLSLKRTLLSVFPLLILEIQFHDPRFECDTNNYCNGISMLIIGAGKLQDNDVLNTGNTWSYQHKLFN